MLYSYVVTRFKNSDSGDPEIDFIVSEEVTQAQAMESLTHLWTCFGNYYRRDKYVGEFLIMTTKWDPADKANYGFDDEAAGSRERRLTSRRI